MASAEGYAEPLGIATAGGALLLITRFAGFETYKVTALLLACALSWLIVTLMLRRRYISALSLAVSRRQNIETGFSGLTGEEARRLVLEKLASDQIADRLSAADMLRKVDPAIYRSLVPDLLKTGDAALVRQVLPDLPALAIDNIDPVLKERLQHETDADVRGHLVLALARSGDSEGTAMLSRQSAKPGPLQELSLAALVGTDFGPVSDYAGTRMRLMAKAPDGLSRRTFLAAATRSGSDVFDDHMMGLFDDPDPETRRAAFHAAGRTGRAVFISSLAQQLAADNAGQENANAVARALTAIGGSAVPVLAQSLEQTANRTARVASASALGLAGAKAARDTLVRFLDDAAPEVSHAAAMSLWTAQARLDAAQSKIAFKAVEKLLQRAAILYQAQADIAELPGSKLLHDALQHRISLLTTQCFMLAALTHGMDSLKSVHLESTTLRSEEKSVAIELVDSPAAAIAAPAQRCDHCRVAARRAGQAHWKSRETRDSRTR